MNKKALETVLFFWVHLFGLCFYLFSMIWLANNNYDVLALILLLFPAFFLTSAFIYEQAVKKEKKN